MGFGNYTGVVATATSTLTVQCTTQRPTRLRSTQGTSSGSSVTARKMTGAAGVFLNYGLYTDSAYATNSSPRPASRVTDCPANYRLRKRSAGQYVAPNTYTDTVTATVTY